MKCLTLIRRHGKTLLPLLAFFLLPIFSLGFSSESASAIDDTVYTYDSSHLPSHVELCNPSNSSCSVYNYLIISFDLPDDLVDSDVSFSPYFRLHPTGFKSFGFYLYVYPLNNYFISLSSFSNDSRLYLLVAESFFGFDSFPDGWSLTFTLTESLSGVPSGSLSIIGNGTYDVSTYAEAVVEVPDTETIIQGDYHDDLVDIKNIALVAIAVALFICFGRLILGMFMGVRR